MLCPLLLWCRHRAGVVVGVVAAQKCSACLRFNGDRRVVLYGPLPCPSTVTASSIVYSHAQTVDSQSESEGGEDSDGSADRDGHTRKEDRTVRYAESESDPELTAADEASMRAKEDAVLSDVDRIGPYLHPAFCVGEFCNVRARLYHVMFHFTTLILLRIQVFSPALCSFLSFFLLLPPLLVCSFYVCCFFAK